MFDGVSGCQQARRCSARKACHRQYLPLMDLKCRWCFLMTGGSNVLHMILGTLEARNPPREVSSGKGLMNSCSRMVTAWSALCFLRARRYFTSAFGAWTSKLAKNLLQDDSKCLQPDVANNRIAHGAIQVCSGVGARVEFSYPCQPCYRPTFVYRMGVK